MKSLYIAEKPSVAQEFGKALHQKFSRYDGYLESEESVVTWCVGHLVTMSYPDRYDEKYKRWSFDTLPFLPEEFKYEIIPSVKKQFRIVSGQLKRKDVQTIYVCTDSGREGEYIYRLVAMMSGIDENTKKQKRVWIDSQTEEEILRGIREAKDLSAYDNLSASAYLRAKEDYLMGINFSRALSLRYAYTVSAYLGKKYQAISVGRVMTCVLGMVVRREREIRAFVKMPFYRVLAEHAYHDRTFSAEWKVTKDSRYFGSPKLYKENGFRKKEDAEELIRSLKEKPPMEAVVQNISRKTEKKNPPLLYNLAELQNDCSRRFHISPDQTLQTVQELYEKKLCTYPRTDARVLSTAIAKQISRNISGLKAYEPCRKAAEKALESGSWKTIGKTKYTNDKQITDHYAIIPTGQGFGALKGLSERSRGVFDLIVRRFLAIFYPPAVYRKVSIETSKDQEHFFANFRILTDPGYLEVMPPASRKKARKAADAGENENEEKDAGFLEALSGLRKGSRISLKDFQIREGETSPPKRYTSGSMILAMENAGQLIEDEDLREQIRGSGIGTSATRAEILKKLNTIHYLSLNKRNQVLTPTQMGEMVYDVVNHSIRSLLNPELTASWEKGLTYVAEGEISSDEYMEKLEAFIRKYTNLVKNLRNQNEMKQLFDRTAGYYH